MRCSRCNEVMIEFAIILRYSKMDGHICPECGFWKYASTRIRKPKFVYYDRSSKYQKPKTQVGVR